MAFTGHERDLGVLGSVADDVDYMHARYYRPLLARFLSSDPIGGRLGVPQSLNRYIYVGDRPITFVDPSGRFYWPYWDQLGSWVILAASGINDKVDVFGAPIEIESLEVSPVCSH